MSTSLRFFSGKRPATYPAKRRTLGPMRTCSTGSIIAPRLPMLGASCGNVLRCLSMGLISLTRGVVDFLRKGLDKVIGLGNRNAPTPSSLFGPIRERDNTLTLPETKQVADLIFESQRAASAVNRSAGFDPLSVDLFPVNPILREQIPSGDRIVYYGDVITSGPDIEEMNRILQTVSAPTELSFEELMELMDQTAKDIGVTYRGLTKEQLDNPETISRLNIVFAQAAF